MSEFKDLTGNHRARCRSVQFGHTKRGDAQAVIGFELLDASGAASGTFLTYFGLIKEPSIDYTVDALRNCGWSGDDLSELPALAERGGLGDEVSLTVEVDEYDGKRSNKIRWVNKAGGKARVERPIDGDDLKALAQNLRSRVRTAGRGKNQNTQARFDDVAPPTDADLPF